MFKLMFKLFIIKIMFSANKSGHYPLIVHSLSNMSKPLNLVMMSPKCLQTLVFLMILDTDTVLKSLLYSISEGPLAIYLGPTPVHKVQFEKHCCKTPLKHSKEMKKAHFSPALRVYADPFSVVQLSLPHPAGLC